MERRMKIVRRFRDSTLSFPKYFPLRNPLISGSVFSNFYHPELFYQLQRTRRTESNWFNLLHSLFMHQLFLSRRTHLTKKRPNSSFPRSTPSPIGCWYSCCCFITFHTWTIFRNPLQVLQLSVLTRVPWEEDSAALPFMAATSSSSMTSNRLR